MRLVTGDSGNDAHTTALAAARDQDQPPSPPHRGGTHQLGQLLVAFAVFVSAMAGGTACGHPPYKVTEARFETKPYRASSV